MWNYLYGLLWLLSLQLPVSCRSFSEAWIPSLPLHAFALFNVLTRGITSALSPVVGKTVFGI